jgi:3'(2'), 5'-bisphosphate nucleotidase
MIKASKNLLLAIHAVIDAGEEILKIYQSNSVLVKKKENNSPVSNADLIANDIIRLKLNSSSYPILSEEDPKQSYQKRLNWTKFWMIDPLDGTKEFLKKNGEFTVNIALIENGIPKVGVVFAPALGQLYFAEKDFGSYMYEGVSKEKKTILKYAKKLPLEIKNKNVVVVSRSHLSDKTIEYLNKLSKEFRIIKMGSSLKLCLIASGLANIYVRHTPIMEWDIAASAAVINYSKNKKFIRHFFNSKNLKLNKLIIK